MRACGGCGEWLLEPEKHNCVSGRKAALLDVLGKAFKEFPDLRLGQLITNATGLIDNWNVQDEEMVQAIAKYTTKWGVQG